jgi:hypothetical protein
MSVIPLDVQRRCERRWAARFSQPAGLVTPRSQRPDRERHQIAGPDPLQLFPPAEPVGIEPYPKDAGAEQRCLAND